MASRTEIIANLEACWSSLLELVDSLEPDDWQVQSLCPDWTVHGVIGHLTMAEVALSGWFPESADAPLPFGSIGELARAARDMSGSELADRFRLALDTRRADLAAMTDEHFAAPSPTPVGPATYGRFMTIREFDFWVHERDIRVPLGRPGDDGGAPAEMALGEVHGSLGYIVGKRVGLPDGMGITFDLTGPVVRRLHVRVDGRAGVVDELADPDVVVTTDSTTFMLLACGRVDPQAVIDEGRITWEGSDEWGDKAARSLRFTM